MNVEVLSYTPDPELLIANCASTCYDSKPKELDKARKMIAAIIKSHHDSCIEVCTVTFRLSNISRTVTHELVRHRIGFSYQQRSQRYVDEKTPSFVTPKEIAENPEALIVYNKCMAKCWESYSRLQELGLEKQIARYVLPNSCCTEICVTANFRAWRNFLKLRLSKRAQPEIRELSKIILEKLIEIAPSCFEDLKDESNLQNT